MRQLIFINIRKPPIKSKGGYSYGGCAFRSPFQACRFESHLVICASVRAGSINSVAFSKYPRRLFLPSVIRRFIGRLERYVLLTSLTIDRLRCPAQCISNKGCRCITCHQLSQPLNLRLRPLFPLTVRPSAFSVRHIQYYLD